MAKSPLKDTPPKPGERGHPSGLTAKRHEDIVRFISAGNYFETACRATRVSERTGFLWLEKGRTLDALDGTPEFDPQNLYVRFYREVEEAKATAEARALQVVMREAVGVTDPNNPRHYTQDPNWKAAVWYLMHARADKFGTKKTVIHEHFVQLAAEAEALIETTIRQVLTAERFGLSREDVDAAEAMAARAIDEWASKAEQTFGQVIEVE